MTGAFTLLLVFQLGGMAVTRLTGAPVPGTVVGFLLLFLGLIAVGGPGRRLHRAASTLLDNLALLFVPVAVGVVNQLPLLARDWGPLALALVVSQVLGMIATALTMKLLMSLIRRRPARGAVPETSNA
ncbi:MAG TPA: CidA/LrgA family protein [Gammaproteobacteria bacterium]|nr:CidA/LrgA family protein [Gammaproteobacteria bacterium]